MNAAIILIIAIAVLLIGYICYGGWLAKEWGIDPTRKTPAHELNDGVDYVPEDFGPAQGDAHSDIQKLKAWLRPNLTMTRFRTEHPKFNMGDPAMFTAIIMALEWVVDKLMEHCSEMERA